MFRNELDITPAPTANIDFNESILNVTVGRQTVVSHNIADFTADRATDCHTIAHAPHPVIARYIPTAPLTISPTALLMAIMRTFICFIRRLV